MNLNFLNDSTLWVAISFLLFVILAFKPLASQLSLGLEKKIADLKKSLDESRSLKEEAEKLYKEQIVKQKENSMLIKKIKEDTSREIKKIKSQIEKDIEFNMLRKINNYNQISNQMENDLKVELKKKIMKKVIHYTEVRIKKNLSKKYNSKLIDESLKKIPKQVF